MIVDAHLDIAWNALAHGRGFTQPSPEHYMVNRDGLAKAGYGLIFASIFTAPKTNRFLPGIAEYGYDTPRAAHLFGRAQVGYYQSVGVQLITNRDALRRHVRGWRPGRIAAILAIENADPVESPRQLSQWWEWGVRVVGPAWTRTRFCGGTQAPGGLTAAGRSLLRAMRRLGMVLDMSHMADRTLHDSLELWKGPLVATHTGARALCDRQRQLPDDVIAAIGERDGMLGLSLYSGHLKLKGRAGVADVVRHARHIASVTGTPECIGIGSDLDGGFDAREAAIGSLDGMRALRLALVRLFGETHADGIMGANWLRFLDRVLPEH